MCIDPVSIGMGVMSFGISAMSSVAEFQGRQRQADQQRQAYYRNEANALSAARDEGRQITLRQMQEQEAAGQRDRQAVVEGAEKEALASVEAAGANVSGLSVDNMIADVSRKVSTNRATLQKNWEMTAAQLQANADAIENRTISRIGQVAYPQEPSPAGMILGIAGAGLNAAGRMSGRA